MAYGMKKPMGTTNGSLSNLEKMPTFTNDTPGEANSSQALIKSQMEKAAASSQGNLKRMPTFTNDTPGQMTPSPATKRTPSSGAINPTLIKMRPKNANARKDALRRMRKM